MRQTTVTQLEHLVELLAGPIFHTGKQCIDSVETFNVDWICLALIFIVSVGVELLLCLAFTLSQTAVTSVPQSKVEYKIVPCYLLKNNLIF